MGQRHLLLSCQYRKVCRVAFQTIYGGTSKTKSQKSQNRSLRKWGDRHFSCNKEFKDTLNKYKYLMLKPPSLHVYPCRPFRIHTAAILYDKHHRLILFIFVYFVYSAKNRHNIHNIHLNRRINLH